MYWNLHAVVMSDSSFIATRNSHAKHNKSVGRIAEHRQSRVPHQRHEISSERRQKKCKYWNLHSVDMSNCSFTATRKSHAKHNESVCRIPCGAEHRQRRVAHQTHEWSSESMPKKWKYWNLQTAVMSDCSLIATRNYHAKHKKSVCRIPERGQT